MSCIVLGGRVSSESFWPTFLHLPVGTPVRIHGKSPGLASPSSSPRRAITFSPLPTTPATTKAKAVRPSQEDDAPKAQKQNKRILKTGDEEEKKKKQKKKENQDDDEEEEDVADVKKNKQKTASGYGCPRCRYGASGCISCNPEKKKTRQQQKVKEPKRAYCCR